MEASRAKAGVKVDEPEKGHVELLDQHGEGRVDEGVLAIEEHKEGAMACDIDGKQAGDSFVSPRGSVFPVGLARRRLDPADAAAPEHAKHGLAGADRGFGAGGGRFPPPPRGERARGWARGL